MGEMLGTVTRARPLSRVVPFADEHHQLASDFQRVDDVRVNAITVKMLWLNRMSHRFAPCQRNKDGIVFGPVFKVALSARGNNCSANAGPIFARKSLITS